MIRPSRSRFTLAVAATALIVACGPPPRPGGGGPTPPPVDNSAGDVHDPANLPLGDYHVSRTTAAPGEILLCPNVPTGGGGASSDGPWIHSNGTWDSTIKATVDGAVTWSGAAFSTTIFGPDRIFSSSAVPHNHTTGVFPIAPTDDAYQWDRNPNHIEIQNVTFAVTATPTVNATPTCTGLGAVGIAANGVAIFNGLDAGARDAVAHELQDPCGGHPQITSVYHYHSVSECLTSYTGAGPSPLVGWALDGFGIYGPLDENGVELTNDDLDECHGRTSPVVWDGNLVTMYHYVATRAYPYTVGCYRGTPANVHPF